MYKKVIFIISVLFYISVLSAQDNESICNLGFKIEISKSQTWGYNEPVVTEVTPGTPAYIAGLRVNDIILEVNGNGTYLKPLNVIMSWFDLEDDFFSIGIRNFSYSFKQMLVDKNCRSSNAISESELATVFSFYSLRDVQERDFIIPVKVSESEDADFFNYRTYNFSESTEEHSELDNQINRIFERVFEQRGLRRDINNPDFIIQTYYSFENNRLWSRLDDSYIDNLYSWRYDTRNSRMVKVPVCNPAIPVANNNIMYFLEFGFRFYDRNYIEPGKPMLVYEAEVKEKLSANYNLLDYLELNIPLILLKFPYSKVSSLGRYRVNFFRFNYTGIHYNINDMSTVVHIDPNSPAERVGILPGDVIVEVQGHSLKHSARSLTHGYRRFISETMHYRDKRTKYTDSNGFENAMFWDIIHYYNVAKALDDKRRYKASFAYLFGFNQYIYWDEPLDLSFKVKRDGRVGEYMIRPEVRRYEQILVD